MESSLSLKRSDFMEAVGVHLGFGRGADAGDVAWSEFQESTIVGIVASGLRQFYFPEPIPPSDSGYDWSFLHPVASLVLPSGANSVTLPDDFGGFEGLLTLSTASTQPTIPVQLYNEAVVRVKTSQFATTTGQPLMAALSPQKQTTGARGQRTDLLIWPLADQAYTLQFQYYFVPEALSGSRPYAIGGTPHVETILESCLSIAEERQDDNQGVHRVKFLSRMAASISYDRKNKPQTLGYNADRSDEGRRRSDYRDWVHNNAPATTFNGSSST